MSVVQLNSSDIEQEDSSEDQGEEYEIEKIVKWRHSEAAGHEYCVKWEGDWGDDSHTWLSAEELENAKEAIDEFWRNTASAKQQLKFKSIAGTSSQGIRSKLGTANQNSFPMSASSCDSTPDYEQTVSKNQERKQKKTHKHDRERHVTKEIQSRIEREKKLQRQNREQEQQEQQQKRQQQYQENQQQKQKKQKKSHNQQQPLHIQQQHQEQAQQQQQRQHHQEQMPQDDQQKQQKQRQQQQQEQQQQEQEQEKQKQRLQS